MSECCRGPNTAKKPGYMPTPVQRTGTTSGTPSGQSIADKLRGKIMGVKVGSK